MAISLGGIQFGISLKLGKTVSGIKNVTAALQALNQVSNSSSLTFAQISQLLGNLGKSSQAAGTQVSNTTQKVESLADAAVALAGALGANQIVSFVKDVTLLAGRVQNLGTVMQNTGAVANYSSGELDLIESRVKQLGITTQATREIMTRFAQNELDVADATKLARIAQDAAVIAGINSSDAADRMAIAVQRLDTRMLRNLGILVNLRQEYQAYGLETGRVETSLTAAEKQQITLNAVMRAGVHIQGNYEKSLRDVYKQYTTLARYQEEAARALGELYLPAFGKLVELTTAGLKAFTAEESGIKSLTATLLGFGGTFATVTAGVVLGKVAWTAFKGALIAAAGPAAAAAGGLALIKGALLGMPGLIIGVAAALGGAFALWSAKSAEAQKRIDEQNRKIDESAAKLVQVRSSVEVLQRLAGQSNLTADEQTKLKYEMESLTNALPDYRQELLKASGSVSEFLTVLQDKMPLAFSPVEKTLDDTRQKIKSLAVELRKLIRESQQLAIGKDAKGRSAIGQVFAAREIDNLIRVKGAELKELQRFEASLTDTIDARLLRRIDEQRKLQETSVQLALRIKKQTADAELKGFNDRGLSVYSDLKRQRSELTSGMLSDAQIQDSYRIARAKVEQEKKLADETDADFKARQESQYAAIEDTRRRDLEDRAVIRQAYEETAQIALRSLDLEARETQRLAHELTLLAKGVLPEEIRAEMSLLEVRDQAKAADEEYLTQIREITNALREQQDLLGSSVASDEAKQAAAENVSALKEQLDILETARKNSSDRRLAEEKKIQAELTRTQKDGIDDRIKDAKSEAQKLIDAKRDAFKSTAEFIGNAKANLLDRQLPGYKDIYAEARSFADAIRGAGTQGQIREIQSLYGPTIQSKLQDMSANGSSPDTISALASQAQRMQALLVQAAQERMQEIQKRDAEFQVQVSQLQYLQKIYQTLSGAGGKNAVASNGSTGVTGYVGPASNRPTGGIGSYLGSFTGNDAARLLMSQSRPRDAGGVSVGDLAQLRSLATARAGTPFDGGVGSQLRSLVGVAGRSTDGVERFTQEVVAGFREMGGQLEEQSRILSTATEAISGIRQTQASNDANMRRQLVGRGL